MKLLTYLADGSEPAGFEGCRRVLRPGPKVWSGKRCPRHQAVGPGLYLFGKVCPGRTLSPSSPCPSISWKGDPLVSLLVCILAPKDNVSFLRAESGIEGWAVGVQGCRTWRAWARGYQARYFSDAETGPERGSDLPKVTLLVRRRAKLGTLMFRLLLLGSLHCSLWRP